MRIKALLFSLAVAIAAIAAPPIPVKWTWSIDTLSPTEGVITWHATIDDGWHIYGHDMPPMIGDMPTTPTTVTIDATPGLELVGKPEPTKAPNVHFDSMMALELPWWEKEVTFTQRFKLADGVTGVPISGHISYMACTDTQCTPRTTVDFDMTFGTAAAAAPAPAPAPVAVAPAQAPAAEQPAPAVSAKEQSDWWAKCDTEQLNREVAIASDVTLWGIVIMGFLGGLLALLTPCVWPMIPMTVSFFLKSTKSRRKAITNALTYALSIIVIFVVLGLVITALFGASKLNEISTSAVFNIIFFLLLVLFAISFFGAFDIKLPSKWSNAIDSKAESTTGLLSIFFMAFTLVLVSFSCTGPIIGTLLVEAASDGNWVGPGLGMAGFALGLALPFGLFAMFPSFLQSMPKSGGWLNSVKVVLGFIELILSLKFLSVADMAYGWRLLDREVFLALWIVLFVLLGMYLLGKLRFSHDSEAKHTSVLGFFLATISFAFAVYLLPGLWGAPLKVTSAFTPPLSTQDFNLYGGGFREFDDYEEGMAYAKETGKPVIIDFTGYGCVNCRKMEMAVFDTPEVRRIIEDDYVLIKLYVDEKTDLPEPYTVSEDYGEDGVRQTKIRTYGDQWSYLQRHRFDINSQPYYVLLGNDGQPLAPSRDYNEDVTAFVNWLKEGLVNYKEHKSPWHTPDNNASKPSAE